MYQNEGLNDISKKYSNIDFSKIDGKLVVPVGAICEKLVSTPNLTPSKTYLRHDVANISANCKPAL